MSVPPHQPDPHGQRHGHPTRPGQGHQPKSGYYQPYQGNQPPAWYQHPGQHAPPGPGQQPHPWPSYEGYGGGYHTALPYLGRPQGPPPRKSRTVLLVTTIVLSALLLVGAGLATWFGLSGSEKLQAGDCFGTAEVAMNAEIYEAECGTVRSSYRVVKVIEVDGRSGKVESACAGSFMEKEPGKILCSTLDVRAFDCMSTGGNPKAVPIKVGCADPRANMVVVKVAEQAPGKRVCARGQTPLGTRVPPLTACLSVLRTS